MSTYGYPHQLMEKAGKSHGNLPDVAWTFLPGVDMEEAGP